MSRFNTRAPQLVAQRVLIAGDETITAGGALTAAVPGTAMQFAIKKDSLVEIRVEGAVQNAGIGQIHLDLDVNGVLQSGGVDGLTQYINSAAAAGGTSVSMSLFLDGLAAGTHSMALTCRAITVDGVINAAAASNPLRITVIEHALIYPPS